MATLLSVDTAVKPVLKVGGRTCQCASCDYFFTGVAPFDRHLRRTGSDDDPICRTPEEMQAIGMSTNIHGVWGFMGRDDEEVELLFAEESEEDDDVSDYEILAQRELPF